MYSASISIDDVINALVVFLTPFIAADGGQCVRAQVNRVPMPANPCCVLTELLLVDLSVPSMQYQPQANSATISGPSRIDVQIDFYGDKASEYCKAAKSAFRSQWGFSQFPANIKPLYTSDGVQSPLVTGEQQYASRWTMTASMQYNPIVTVPQDFADALSATVELPVDL